MTLFEKHLGRKMKRSDKACEIEFYVSLVLTKEDLINRERLINKNKPKQLKLEL